MRGESPTLPGSLPVIPPVEVAHAMLPEASMATAPTVSWSSEVDLNNNNKMILW